MSAKTNQYEIDPHIAEIYDQIETSTDDIQLIRRLIEGRKSLRILEPFCGTGRILLSLAEDGHEVVGLDQSSTMLARAQTKIHRLSPAQRDQITLIEADVLHDEWPPAFDLVILGGNCFYELATPLEQEHCIVSAMKALTHEGNIYVDNNHMEGDLDLFWQKSGEQPGSLTGTCADGAIVETTREVIWHDAAHRLIRFRYRTRVILPDGSVLEYEFTQQKHPVSTIEVQHWLEQHGFTIIHRFGDRAGNAYTANAPRAIFWACQHTPD